MAGAEKISLYNLSELKNTTDDAIPNYLNSLKFKQSHFYTDVRLGLGYSAFVLAAACFWWDYKYGFDDTKLYTSVAVVFYAILSYGLGFWVTSVEKGTVYTGTAPSGEKISLVSSTKKHDPTYNLAITLIKPTSSAPDKIEVSRAFNNWFDETGLFVAPPFQEFLASSVPAIGKQDPKRVRTETQDLLDANPELLDALVAANATGSGAEPAAKKGGKKRK